MSCMSRIIKISLKSIISRFNIVYFLAISLLTTVLLAFYNIPTYLLHGIQENKALNFGRFAGLSISDNSEDISEKYADNVGIIAVNKKMQYENYDLIIGSIDALAYELSGIKLLSGELPFGENEIVITESVSANTGADINDTLTLDNVNYSVVGIITDYGRLWVRGEQDYETPNVIIRSDKYFISEQMYYICLFKDENSVKDFDAIKNVNGLLKEKIFDVPIELTVMIYAASAIIVYMLLALNITKVVKRVKIYMTLGMEQQSAAAVVAVETVFLTLGGLLAGLVLNIFICGLAGIIFDFKDTLFANFVDHHFAILTVLYFVSVSLYMLKVSIASRERFSGNLSETKERKFKKHTTIIYISSAAVSVALLSYGLFYGSYFSENVYEDVPGTLTKDFDFRFVTELQPSTPASGRVFMITDSSEKNGADDSFLSKLKNEPLVSDVRAYKENNKVMIITDNNIIDDYLDGFDFYLDGEYNIMSDMMLIDMPEIQQHFGFGDNDRLVAAKLVGYPVDKMEKIIELIGDKSVDIRKIVSGEEVILRVPSYCLIENNDGSVRRVTRGMNGYTEEASINNMMLQKGDELNLCQLYSDNDYNGAVPLEDIANFQRIDKTVKIAAVISEPIGMYQSNSFPRAYELLTVNEAFSELGFDSTYSVVDIYTNDTVPEEELSAIISSYSVYAEKMKFENWIMQVKNYRLFNNMIGFFYMTFLIIIILTDLIFLSVQIYSGITAKMRYYKILWINGMPKDKIVSDILLYALKVSLLSAILLGVPLSFILFKSFALRAESDVWGNIIYYFDFKLFLPVIAIHIFMLIIAYIPSISALHRSCNNFMGDD